MQDDVEPACKTSVCPIGEEIATDPEINDIAMGYRQAKILHEANKIDEMFIRKLKEIGIWDNETLLIQLESLYYEDYARRRKQEDSQRAIRSNRSRFR